MSSNPFHRFHACSPDATAALAGRIAPLLRPGDTLLLEGGIGAGKTHFARSLIRAVQGPGRREDIPSPTFTLVQTYDSPIAEIWHADLYRLTDLSEVLELGLDDALDTAICLIEWPDRLGQAAPTTALTLSFTPNGDDARDIVFGGGVDWASRLAKVLSKANTP